MQAKSNKSAGLIWPGACQFVPSALQFKLPQSFKMLTSQNDLVTIIMIYVHFVRKNLE